MKSTQETVFQIIDALRSKSYPVTASEIAEEIGKHAPFVSGLLTNLRHKYGEKGIVNAGKKTMMLGDPPRKRHVASYCLGEEGETMWLKECLSASENNEHDDGVSDIDKLYASLSFHSLLPTLAQLELMEAALTKDVKVIDRVARAIRARHPEYFRRGA